MLAEQVDYVIGVDTHRDEHVLAVVVAATGALVAQHAVAAEVQGYREAVSVGERYAHGVRVWAIEGAGHYGAGFARYLAAAGETVIEAGRSVRGERRLRGKDDPLDALRAARSALVAESLTLPRAGQHQEALRVLLLARRSAVDVRRLALVQMRSVIVTAPDRLRAELRRLPTCQLIRRCSRFRRSSARTPTSSRSCSLCARSRGGSKPRPKRRTSSSERSSATSACSCRNSSTSPASGRSSPRN
jgi:transposase